MVIAVVCLCLAFCTALQAQEFRGAWVTSWSPGFFTADQIDKTIADAKAAGLNALIIEVRKEGDAYYQSDLEPVGQEVPKGFDPLAYCIEKAHAEGIRVCAWLVVYRVWRGSKLPDNPKHVLRKHPEWRSATYDGKMDSAEGAYVDPGIPEYREWFAKVCEDIARRYAVDAIHYDYVRYPAAQWGYSELALKRYYAETGAKTKPKTDDPKWLQWRRDQITAMVTLVKNRVKAVNPNVTIQASTIPWGDCPADFKNSAAYRQVGQDWRLWMEKGLIDENIPMVYARDDEKGMKYYSGWVDGAKKWKYGGKVYVGTSAGRGSADGILKQIDMVRKAGLEGFALFSFNQSSRRPERAAALGKGLGPAPKLTVNQSISTPPDPAKQAKQAFDRGIQLAMANKLDEAIVELGRALEMNPKYAEAAFRIGRCHLRSNNEAKAKEFFQKALAIDPKHNEAKAELEKLTKSN